MTRSLLLALALGLTASAALAQPCTTSWTNAAGGAWATGANWDAGVPDAADHACITLNGTYTVTVAGFTVDRLTLGRTTGGAQTLVNSGNVAIASASTIRATGIYEWTNGYQSGAGTLTNLGTVRLTGGTGSRGVNGATLRNEGTVEHSGAGLFYIYSGGRVENAAAWNVTDAGNIYGSSGAGTFVNEATGMFTKSGAGTALFTSGGLVVENTGTMTVQEGLLRFDRPSTHTGATLTTAAAGTLQFNAGGVTFVGTTAGAQDGSLTVNDAIVAGAGAAWNFSGTAIQWTNNYLSGGTLTNQGLLRLTGGTGGRGTNGATLRNTGTVEHSGAGLFYIYSGGRIENTGAWSVTDEGDYYGSSGAGTFTNTGTFTKSGAGTALFSSGGLVVENTGTMTAQEGLLRFDRPSTHTNATLTTATGAAIQFNAGGVTFVGTTAGAQAGSLSVNDAITASGGTATWNFTGTGMAWTDNYVVSGTLKNSGLIRLTGGTGSRGVQGATAFLKNPGTVEHSGAGLFYIYSGGRIENTGAWSVTDEGDYYGSSGAGTFTNTGTFTKSGAGTALFSSGGLVVENTGTMTAQEGLLRFDRPSTHTNATLTTATGAAIQFNAGGVTFVGTTAGAQAGSLSVNDAITASGGTATWNFTGTGMAWTDNYVVSGTLKNSGLIRLTGGTGSRGVRNAGAQFRNTGTVEHADAGLFYIFSGGRVENAAAWSVTSEGDYYGSSGAGTFVNEATGTFVRSGAGTTLFSSGGLVVENAGTMRADSGEIDVDRPLDHQAGAVIGGSGVFDVVNASPFTFTGDTAPGDSTGVLTWQNTWAPSAGSALRIDLNGLTPGTEHDQLAVATTATLDGTLALDLVDGYVPALGDTYTVLTAATVSGTFAAIAPTPGLEVDVTYNAGSVVVTVTAIRRLSVERRRPTSPVVVPPEGATIIIKHDIANLGPDADTFDTWLTLTRPPNGNTVAAGGPDVLTLASGATIKRKKLLTLAAGARAGTYIFTRYVGTYPDLIIDSESYTFTKAEAPPFTEGLADALAAYVADEGEVDEGVFVVSADGGAGETMAPAEAASTIALPTETALLAPFPNPAAGRVAVRYELAEAASVRVTVYDALGRAVAVVADEAREAGRYEASVDASRLAPGVYVVRLTAGPFAATQRLTVVR